MRRGSPGSDAERRGSRAAISGLVRAVEGRRCRILDQKRRLTAGRGESLREGSTHEQDERQLDHGTKLRRQSEKRLNYSAASSVGCCEASISAALASTSLTMCSIMSASCTWWSVTPDRYTMCLPWPPPVMPMS